MSSNIFAIEPIKPDHSSENQSIYLLKEKLCIIHKIYFKILSKKFKLKFIIMGKLFMLYNYVRQRI